MLVNLFLWDSDFAPGYPGSGTLAAEGASFAVPLPWASPFGFEMAHPRPLGPTVGSWLGFGSRGCLKMGSMARQTNGSQLGVQVPISLFFLRVSGGLPSGVVPATLGVANPGYRIASSGSPGTSLACSSLCVMPFCASDLRCRKGLGCVTKLGLFLGVALKQSHTTSRRQLSYAAAGCRLQDFWHF